MKDSGKKNLINSSVGWGSPPANVNGELQTIDPDFLEWVASLDIVTSDKDGITSKWLWWSITRKHLY